MDLSTRGRSVELEWQQLALASTRGVFARSTGVLSYENPYLRPEAMPFRTGESHAEWFNKCDAWWRGWDAEDTRRRDQSLLTAAERSH